MDTAKKVLDLVLSERDYQRQRWGDDHDKGHTLAEWLAILTVYMGKIANEVPPYRESSPQATAAFLKRLAQLTAIGLAAQEAVIRQMGGVAAVPMEIEHTQGVLPPGIR